MMNADMNISIHEIFSLLYGEEGNVKVDLTNQSDLGP